MVHADRVLALLRERRVVDDPGLDRPVLLNYRQHHLAYLGQHPLVRPRRDTDKVQQRLMLRRRPRWRRLPRHRLGPPPLPRTTQTGRETAQRPPPRALPTAAPKPRTLTT